MPVAQITSSICRFGLLGLALALPIGCAESNVRDSKSDPAVDKSLSDQARKMRANSGDDDHHSVGLSDEARDIERDLGIK